MIRYISYIGPREEKRIDLSIGKAVYFPQGEVVDVVDAGMGERKALELLATGLFKLHEGPVARPAKVVKRAVPEALEPPRLVCGCGKVCKNNAGLAAHKRSCKC